MIVATRLSSPKSSLESFRSRSVSKKEPVPSGLCDRSQAIYCLECVQKGDPSRRDGVSRATGRVPPQDRRTCSRPNHTVPYGTGRALDASQAINCLATIIQSLRDKFRQTPVGQQTVSTCPRYRFHIIFEHEHDDEDEMIPTGPDKAFLI